MNHRKVYEWVARIKEWLMSAVDAGQTSIITYLRSRVKSDQRIRDNKGRASIKVFQK
jgi:hypothetical protein